MIIVYSESVSPTPNRGFLRYKEDRLNLVRAVLSVPILLLPALTGLPDGWLGVGYGLAIWFLLNDMNFLLHQHVHNRWTTSPVANRGLDWLLSCVTGMSAYNWRQQHLLRHHRGDDSWGKAFDWEFRRPTMLGALSYSLRGVPIVYLYPLWEAFVKGGLSNRREPISYRAAFAEQACVACIIATLNFLEPGFYIPYYFFVLFFTRLTDYNNHVGCNQSAYGFSNNTLLLCYNWTRNNFGYHTAHHYFPDAHWTELAARHAEIVDRIPSERCGTALWTGPAFCA